MKTRLTEEQKIANREAKKAENAAKKETARIETEKNQLEVKEITITIEWKHSRTWGNCPRATAAITYKDKTAGEYGTGFYRTDEGKYYASGCGYDKESTVIAEIFNDFLKYKLWQKTPEQLKRAEYDYKWKEENRAPYGIYSGENYRHFDGGIGVNCYKHISEYIGGKFENVASGKTFDVYKYTDNE